MNIGQGLFSGMVLQRTWSGRSDAHFSGISKISCAVLATVTQDGRTTKGWRLRKIRYADRGKLSGRIRGGFPQADLMTSIWRSMILPA